MKHISANKAQINFESLTLPKIEDTPPVPSILATTVLRDVESLLEQMDTTYKDLVRIDQHEGKQSFAMSRISIQINTLKKIQAKILHETITK